MKSWKCTAFWCGTAQTYNKWTSNSGRGVVSHTIQPPTNTLYHTKKLKVVHFQLLKSRSFLFLFASLIIGYLVKKYANLYLFHSQHIPSGILTMVQLPESQSLVSRYSNVCHIPQPRNTKPIPIAIAPVTYQASREQAPLEMEIPMLIVLTCSNNKI